MYQFQNNFDYSRWNEKTKIKLCNVIWNSDYTDVVKWDDNEKRDSWFDSLTDFWATELKTAARIVPEGYVKLPIPYDVMARYNYLFIDMPIATSSDNPIDYENDEGIRRWYFFVNSITYLSPNATQVFVVPDIWTNFQNDIEITYMLLERGHAPVAYSDTTKYLQNPIANNRYLLAPDVNFDNAGITRSSSFAPFGNGTKYVCVASTCSPDLVSTLGTVTENSAYNPSGTITYSDVDARYGHQLEVHGFSIGNGRDYSNARTPAKVGYSDGIIANNLTVYAIAATECYGNGTFFADVLRTCPQFLTTVKACFVVDDACITRGTAYAIAGHTLYQCVGKSSTLLEKALTISDFGYPSELQRFAKLYTAPYAQLEITDNDGKTYDVNIEETSTLSVKSIVSVAFPYINERVYVDGIGGVGSKSYTWRDLNGNLNELGMQNSDWFKYCFDWEIPTFALYMDGQTAYMLETFNRNVKQGIQQSLVAYHNTMRSANTDYENSCDYADTTKTNSDNSAATAQTNTYNNADLSYRTVDRVCTMQSQNLATNNANIAMNEEFGITASDSITRLTNDASSVNVLYANALSQATTDTNIETSSATTMTSGIGSIASAALNGAQAGIVMGSSGGAAVGAIVGEGIGALPGWAVGALGGAVIGGIGGGISAAVNNMNAGTTNNANQTITDAQKAANSNTNAASISSVLDINDINRDLRREIYRDNATSSTTQMDNSNATSRANATDARNTTKTNADNSKSTANTNASNLQTVSKGNSGYTRQVAELNAKEILENGRYASMAAIDDSRNSAPIEVCQYSGSPQPDYMRTRGVQIKVKTQSDSAIRQTGDTFARFGYALNQIWNVSETGLNLMRNFTYWKAAEIWVDDRKSSNNAINNFIHNMFLNGVTVWSDPTKIGRVNVYDN